MRREIATPVLVALGSVLFDVYLMGIPTTMWGLGVVALIRLVQLLARSGNADALLAARRTKRVVIYGAGIVLIILGIAGNVKLAAWRGARVAAAVKQYRAANGDYPERLEQLVPAYLPEIPNCCIRAVQPKFHYHRLPDRPHPVLYWIAMVPFGKGDYFFDRDELKPLWD